MLLALLAGCADLLIDSIKDQYTPEAPAIAVGAVWPPLDDAGADATRTVGGVASTRVGHDGRVWTYDLTWGFVFLDDAGAPIGGVESQIQLGWSEWATPEGEVYRITSPMTCEPAAAGGAVPGARLGVLLDHTNAAATVDPDGERRAAAEALLAGQAGRYSGFGVGVYAEGSGCFDDVDVLERGGGAFPADAEGWAATIDGLAGCEAGARHFLYDGLDALAATADADGGGPEDTVLVAFVGGADAGSTATAGTLAASLPPVFEVRADGVDDDVVDEVLITQTSGGALVLAPAGSTGAAFAAVGTLLDGGAAGYRCTAQIEVEMADESRTPSWLESYAYLPPTAGRVQVSVPWIVGFSTL